MEFIKNGIALLVMAVLCIIGAGAIGIIVSTLLKSAIGLTITDFLMAAGVISSFAVAVYIAAKAAIWAYGQLTK